MRRRRVTSPNPCVRAGVEVWFDVEGGLEHGDEWDAKIRRQIKECVLFIPIISANTQARHEGCRLNQTNHNVISPWRTLCFAPIDADAALAFRCS